jgi:3-isopropylmalate/(R)-2-methylmalate dehydratase large subunit
LVRKTLYEKLWESHIVHDYGDGAALLYVDRHLVQEVSSPVAFAELAKRNLPVRRPFAHLAVPDHAVSTDPDRPMAVGSLAALQVERLSKNCAATGMPFIGEGSAHQGIVHVIGPESGFTLPGCTLVCGDSHTSTHGAFGALAFGIGASQCEMVMATQCLVQHKLRNMRITLDGELASGVTVKDVVLALIAEIGTGGATGFAVEYAGSLVAALSMEQRMTLCNMTIEAGGRIGLVAPDATTLAYLNGRPLAPSDAMWDRACVAWAELKTDADTEFDSEIRIDVSNIAPQVSWGTNPSQTIGVDQSIPADIGEGASGKALAYMGLTAGQKIAGVPIQRVFIGSCTNGRIEDLRAAAAVAIGRKVASTVSAMVVPGSASVARQASREGLDRVFREAGFSWRNPGCSMCVAMNDDRLQPGERCASTSNRNFEGRQGQGGLTHIMSPQMAAAAAVTGAITDVRSLMGS